MNYHFLSYSAHCYIFKIKSPKGENKNIPTAIIIPLNWDSKAKTRESNAKSTALDSIRCDSRRIKCLPLLLIFHCEITRFSVSKDNTQVCFLMYLAAVP